MHIPTPLTIGTSSEEFLIRDDSKSEGLLPLLFFAAGIVSVIFGLIHWYELSLLLKGQITTNMGIILTALAASIAGMVIWSNAKIQKSQLIIVNYNYWLAEKHGLVAKEPFGKMEESIAGNAEFTDMNGDTVNRKIHVTFDYRMGGTSSNLKKVPYFNISLHPIEAE